MAIELPSYIAGEAVRTNRWLNVYYPWDNSLTGRVAMVGPEHLNQAIEAALAGHPPLTRYQRHDILRKAAGLLAEHREELAQLICRETGLCMRETMYETGRSSDVLEFAAMEALNDDGQVFSCDISPQGKARKIFTFRQPVQLVGAITPFNHPLNQVAHKLAPAIAAGAPILLKPSEKTPLTSIRFCEILYEAGLPGWMLSMFVGDIDEVVAPMIADPRIELVSFTGSVAVGKHIASMAGYKKTCLELGGNSPLIILEDADLDQAVTLAAEGCFRNSGQRCTAVKRVLVQESIHDEFSRRFVEKAREYVAGDPEDPDTRVGTVIDEKAAIEIEDAIKGAISDGAKVLCGNKREGALIAPTVIDHCKPDSDMVMDETFGPVAPIIRVKDVEEACKVANSTEFGLQSGVVTNNLANIRYCIKHLKVGAVNINEGPQHDMPNIPFGGVKQSGIGREGIRYAMQEMTYIKCVVM